MKSPQEIQQLLTRLLEQDNEHAVVLIDSGGQIVAWLAAAEKVFGYTADEVIGKPLSMLFTPEDIAKAMPDFEMAVASQDGHAEDDRWMQRKDGRRFWATGTLVPIRGDERAILAFGKILRNRTDIKGQLEAAHQSIERSQDVSESKNVFITTLAHELRSPLAAIENSLAILEKTGADNDNCRYARATIQRQLDHIQRMIEDLLDVARADKGKIRLNPIETTLNEIVTAAVESCRPSIDKCAHDLQLLMTDRPIMISADPVRLQQVFINLIENAAKYTGRGGHIWVKVSVEGDEAVAKVEDTGIGIAPEVMPQIFDLFTQAEAISAEGSGLGIGLSLVKNLTHLHGGTVQVRSDGPGKGSEFTVRLPLAGVDALRPNRPQTNEQAAP